MTINEKITDTKTLEFVIFCVENVAIFLGAEAEKVYAALNESNILSEYIIPEYEMLHTQSKEYIINDIMEIMRERDVKI